MFFVSSLFMFLSLLVPASDLVDVADGDPHISRPPFGVHHNANDPDYFDHFDPLDPVKVDRFPWNFARIGTNYHVDPAKVRTIDSDILIKVSKFKSKTHLTLDFPEAPADLQHFRQFVTDLVERFDADGINDDETQVKINTWMLGNELWGHGWGSEGGIDQDGNPVPKNKTFRSYAEALKIFAEEVRSHIADAEIMLAGATIAGIPHYTDELLPVIKEVQGTGEQPFHIFDIHFFNFDKSEEWLLKYRMLSEKKKDVETALINLGFNNVEFFSEQTAPFSGFHSKQQCENPPDDNNGGGSGFSGPSGGNVPGGVGSEQFFVSESDHAGFWIRQTIDAVASGYRALMYGSVVEYGSYGGDPCSLFTRVAMVHDKNNNEINNPDTYLIMNDDNQDGIADDWIKNVLRTIQFLTVALDGVTAEDITELDQKLPDDVRAFRITTNSLGTIFIIWRDYEINGEELTPLPVEIDVATKSEDTAFVINMAPNSKWGYQFSKNDFLSNFPHINVPVIRGRVYIQDLNRTPLLILPYKAVDRINIHILN